MKIVGKMYPRKGGKHWQLYLQGLLKDMAVYAFPPKGGEDEDDGWTIVAYPREGKGGGKAGGKAGGKGRAPAEDDEVPF